MSSYSTILEKKTIKEKVIDLSKREIPIVAIIGFIGITGLVIFMNEEKSKLLKKLITDKLFLTSLTIIIGFSIHQLWKGREDSEVLRRKKATKEAILGLIIAILAYLDLKAAPFFIIWIISYYLD
jgi:hypothetical protein